MHNFDFQIPKKQAVERKSSFLSGESSFLPGSEPVVARFFTNEDITTKWDFSEPDEIVSSLKNTPDQEGDKREKEEENNVDSNPADYHEISSASNVAVENVKELFIEVDKRPPGPYHFTSSILKRKTVTFDDVQASVPSAVTSSEPIFDHQDRVVAVVLQGSQQNSPALSIDDIIKQPEEGPKMNGLKPGTSVPTLVGGAGDSLVIVLTGRMDKRSTTSTPDVDKEVYAINKLAPPPTAVNGRVAHQRKSRLPSTDGQVSVCSDSDNYDVRRQRRRKPVKLGRMRLFRTILILLAFGALVS